VSSATTPPSVVFTVRHGGQSRGYASRLVNFTPAMMSSPAVYPANTAKPTHGENA
jgi:hypothetical protein